MVNWNTTINVGDLGAIAPVPNPPGDVLVADGEEVWLPELVEVEEAVEDDVVVIVVVEDAVTVWVAVVVMLVVAVLSVVTLDREA